jgi:hypothetical protein
VGKKRDNFHGSFDLTARIQEFNVIDIKHTSKTSLDLLVIFQRCSLMATNFLSDSDLRAEQQQEKLSISVNALLESNRNLSRRLMNLEDTFDVRSILTKGQSVISSSDPIDPKGSKVQPTSSAGATEELSSNISKLSVDQGMDMKSNCDFETDLESSRVYRRAQRDTMEFSFRSSIAETNAWSIFSGGRSRVASEEVRSEFRIETVYPDISNR